MCAAAGLPRLRPRRLPALRKLFHRLPCQPRLSSTLLLFILLLLLLLILLFLTPHSFPVTSFSAATRASWATSILSLQTPSAPPGVLLLVETRFNGLGAQLLRHIDALALASHLGWSFTPCFGRYWNYGCAPHRAWQCYFEPNPASSWCEAQHHCPELESLAPDKISLQECLRISTDASADLAAAVLSQMSGDLLSSRRLAHRIWHLNQNTAADVRMLLRLAGVVNLSEYVGVHVRRGDKGKEVDNVPLRRYAAAVKALSLADTPVFVAADDGASVRQMRRMLPGRTILAIRGVEGRKGHDQMQMNQRFMKKNYWPIVELLAEIEALRGAKLFVGTFSSNLGRFVHLLREDNATSSVSLDDRWAPGVAWRTFGKGYCSSEDANEVYCAKVRQDKIGS